MPLLSRRDRIYLDYSRDIDRVVEDWGDHEGLVKSKVLRWADQFEDADLPLAMKVLKKIRYYSSSNIRSMTSRLVEMTWDYYRRMRKKRIFFIPIGLPQQGSSFIARALRDTPGVWGENIIDMVRLEKLRPEKIDALVFFDDFFGTGDTLSGWWQRARILVQPKNVPVTLAPLVLNEPAKLVARRIADSVLSVEELRDHDNVFAASSPRFEASEKRRLLRYCKTTGCDKDRVKGFGSCGLLVAFKHGCPDNSLPILWSSVEGQWEGLFRRSGL